MIPVAMIPAPSELILILLIVVMIFGAKRIPEIMGGLGQGIKTFKKAMEGEDVTETLPPQVPAQTSPEISQASSPHSEKTDLK
ncbi:MAG: twin-arginine translocase TatA/TatE family subunit [Desulfomonilaceae bacterium]